MYISSVYNFRRVVQCNFFFFKFIHLISSRLGQKSFLTGLDNVVFKVRNVFFSLSKSEQASLY